MLLQRTNLETEPNDDFYHTPEGLCLAGFSADDEETYEYLSSLGGGQAEVMRATFLNGKLWPKSFNLKVGFMSNPARVRRSSLSRLKKTEGYDSLEETIFRMRPVDAVKKVLQERVAPVIGLTFTFVSNPSQADIRIDFDERAGAWSYIGTDATRISKREPTMNLGWLDAQTIVHEFGHALGLIHEHQNPRGNPIKWDEEKLYQYFGARGWDRKTTYHNIIRPYSVNSTNGSDFDPDSVMLYWFDKNLTKNGVGTKQNGSFSCTDIEILRNGYPARKNLDQIPFYRSKQCGGFAGGDVDIGSVDDGTTTTTPTRPENCPVCPVCPPQMTKRQIVQKCMEYMIE